MDLAQHEPREELLCTCFCTQAEPSPQKSQAVWHSSRSSLLFPEDAGDLGWRSLPLRDLLSPAHLKPLKHQTDRRANRGRRTQTSSFFNRNSVSSTHREVALLCKSQDLGTKRNFSFYPVVKICRIHSLSLWLSRERRREMDEKGTRNKNKTQIKAMGLRKWPCLGGRKLGVPSIVMMSKGCPQGLLEGTGQSLIPAA